MMEVLSCLTNEHDHSFVMVAAIVCIAGSAMTMQLYRRALKLIEGRSVWLLLSGIAGGTAIWTTHFVAMLGFNPPVEHAYDPVLTLASLLVAMIFTAAGLHVATAGGASWRSGFGGALIGLGVAAMHFTGMAGLEAAGTIRWDWTLVAVSVVLGILFGGLATAGGSRPGALGLWLGSVALVLAICSMHFTAMGAADFIPGPQVPFPPGIVSSELIAISVVAIISVVTGSALYVMDARSQREMMAAFRHAALHDALTQMPNRAFLSSSLPALLEEARDGRGKVAVLVVDLDRFKGVNDVHGHHVGDALLCGLAERLKGVLGSGELVCRVGGDEFIAVKTGIGGPADAEQFARRLTMHISEPMTHADRTLSVGASVGVSIFPDDAENADDLIGVADLAMYRAKKGVGHKICFYEKSMDEGRRKQSALAMELRHAIERNEFELFYQQQIDVMSGKTTAFEALLRWNHKERGLVSPAEFIPVAEETGLILPIGEWVLRRACADAARWKEDYRLAVNIASAQLTQGDLLGLVHEVLVQTGLAPSRLELEITEASIIDDQQHTLHVIRQLKALGVTVAMDDYGTGYSSLSTLQKFPFDKIKIDKSFIEDVTTNHASMAIVKATILLANRLGIPVLAEGVERKEHFEFLRAEGCKEAQGYLFDRPRPITEISSLADTKSAA